MYKNLTIKYQIFGKETLEEEKPPLQQDYLGAAHPMVLGMVHIYCS